MVELEHKAFGNNQVIVILKVSPGMMQCPPQILMDCASSSLAPLPRLYPALTFTMASYQNCGCLC